jgi:hypothetical protein
MWVEAFISELTVEALDEPVLCGPTRLNEVEPAVVFVGPSVEGTAAELGTIVRRELRG